MTFAKFDEFTEEMLGRIRNMRDTKGKEYAGTEDRFGNFNRLAADCGISREKVWQVYYTKHWDSIKSYIQNGTEFSTETIDGRIVDAMTYLLLLAGMIKENKEKEKELLN